MLNQVIEQFDLEFQSIHEVDDSHSSTVYKCRLVNGENVYLKIPFSKLKYQRELEAYEILSGRVVIPEMLDYWSGNEESPGAFLLSELKGEPLTTEVSPKAAFQVGVLHASLHTVQPAEKEKLTGIKNEFPNWSLFVERQFLSFAEDVKDVLDKNLYDRAIKKFADIKEQLPGPDGPSFVHMDFRPANIIIQREEVVGVIDFESVRFGATEIDFTKLYRDFLSRDTAFYRAYQDGYTSIRPIIDLEAVLPFYLFTDAFNSIGWCKRRGIEKHALFFEENTAILKEILT